MKSKTSLPVCLLLLAGCIPASSTRRSSLPVRPATIITDETEATPDDLMETLKAQEAAVASMDAEPSPTPPAEETPSAPPQPDAPVPAEAASVPPAELSVDHLIAMLEAKPARTPAEEESYKRLLGLFRPRDLAPSEGSEVYALLFAAREAVAAGDFAAAQSRATEALNLVRRKTDPTIVRVVIAASVRNYADADVLENPVLRRGSTPLVVTDISDFACLPVSGESPPSRYYTRMTQRIAVYDAKGTLYGEESYGPFEYQASSYVANMFIPRYFRLPAKIKHGQYTLKSEIVDELAGRQAEGSVEFTVK